MKSIHPSLKTVIGDHGRNTENRMAKSTMDDATGEHFPDVEDARRRYDQAKSETDAVAPPGWPGLDAAA